MRILSFTTHDDQEIPIGKLTVLVGPNNVGKSQTLSDIRSIMTEGADTEGIIIKSIEFDAPNAIDDLLIPLRVETAPQRGHQQITGVNAEMTGSASVTVLLENLKRSYEAKHDPAMLLHNLSRFYVAHLRGPARLEIAKSKNAFNLRTGRPANLVHSLYLRPDLQKTLRELFNQTFGTDIVLDDSEMTRLVFKVGRRIPPLMGSNMDRCRALDGLSDLDNEGDGFLSFIAVALTVLVLQWRVILLDEPEAFLHPSQARRLGAWIAERSADMKGQIIIATHNASFLGGVLSGGRSGSTNRIYRLHRHENDTDYHEIPPDVTSKLATDLLLSSQRVLESVFYEGVAVCEGDSDRAYYQAVAAKEFSNSKVFFTHAHGKNAMYKIVEVEKGAGIPVCAIADLDILRDRGDFERAVQSLSDTGNEALLQRRKMVADAVSGEPEEVTLATMKTLITELAERIRQDEQVTLAQIKTGLGHLHRIRNKWSGVKKSGVESMPEAVREEARIVLDSAAKLGLFIVPVGELESWEDYKTRRVGKWLQCALEALAKERCSPDAKEFVGRVLRYLEEEAQTPL